MLPWTHGQESKLRAGNVSGRIGLRYEMYKKNTFFKREPQAVYNDQFFFINIWLSVLTTSFSPLAWKARK